MTYFRPEAIEFGLYRPYALMFTGYTVTLLEKTETSCQHSRPLETKLTNKKVN